MIVSVKEILTKAKEGGYAVGAFNTVNLETTRAIIEGAMEMRSPVIVQITEKTMEYGGGRGMFHLVKNDAEFYASDIPIGIHLDHGHSFEIIQRAITIGFTSVLSSVDFNSPLSLLLIVLPILLLVVVAFFGVDAGVVGTLIVSFVSLPLLLVLPAAAAAAIGLVSPSSLDKRALSSFTSFTSCTFSFF